MKTIGKKQTDEPSPINSFLETNNDTSAESESPNAHFHAVMPVLRKGGDTARSVIV